MRAYTGTDFWWDRLQTYDDSDLNKAATYVAPLEKIADRTVYLLGRQVPQEVYSASTLTTSYYSASAILPSGTAVFSTLLEIELTGTLEGERLTFWYDYLFTGSYGQTQLTIEDASGPETFQYTLLPDSDAITMGATAQGGNTATFSVRADGPVTVTLSVNGGETPEDVIPYGGLAISEAQLFGRVVVR